MRVRTASHGRFAGSMEFAPHRRGIASVLVAGSRDVGVPLSLGARRVLGDPRRREKYGGVQRAPIAGEPANRIHGIRVGRLRLCRRREEYRSRERARTVHRPTHRARSFASVTRSTFGTSRWMTSSALTYAKPHTR